MSTQVVCLKCRQVAGYDWCCGNPLCEDFGKTVIQAYQAPPSQPPQATEPTEGDRLCCEQIKVTMAHGNGPRFPDEIIRDHRLAAVADATKGLREEIERLKWKATVDANMIIHLSKPPS